MKKESKSKAKAPAAKRAPKSTTKSAKAEVNSKKAGTKTAGARAARTEVPTKAASAKTIRAKSEPATKRASNAKKPETKTAGAKVGKAKVAAAKVRSKIAKPVEEVVDYRAGEPIADPIEDTTDAEVGKHKGNAESPAAAEMEAFQADTAAEAMDSPVEAAVEQASAVAREAMEAGVGESVDNWTKPESREPRKLERLQKILSQAGVASRRHAEEMITAGLVMVNGQVVTQLGSKADPEQDHIRVDGKLLKGAERHRYFLLNKPKGYVTTVSDPEGRPTVMEFLAKTHERLYPVGRLDYLSEGLLLMTNDGELANLLTKAGSGVEKTYLVKVAGQPSEEELERLRGGVEIERGEEGSSRVRTAPARVKQVREGDNPWYEVVLIEGRNRELRKMFSAVGHFVEKIRRVGYGPLVLDVEPGKLRELDADELTALRLTVEGKMKPRRMKVDRVLPKDAGRGAEKKFDRRAEPRRDRTLRRDGKPIGRQGERPGFDQARFERPKSEKPGFGGGPREVHGGREGGGFKSGGFEGGGSRSGEFKREGGFKRPESGERGSKPFGAKRPFAGGQRPFGGGRPGSGPRPRIERPTFERPREERGAGRPGEFVERPKFDASRPFAGGPRPERTGSSFGAKRPFTGAKGPFGGGRTSSGPKRGFERPGFERTGFGGGARGSSEGRSGDATRRPFRPQGERPYSKPSGPPRLRIDSAPEKRFDKVPEKSWAPRADRPRSEGPREGTGGPGRSGGAFRGKSFAGPGAGAGRPKPAFGSKPSFGSRPGGFAKSNRPGGFARSGKPGGGARRGGPRFGGKKPGGR